MFEDKKWDKTFKDRLAKHYDELKWLYSELYHNDQQAFNYFCDMMYEYYEKRSPMLREWDPCGRGRSPRWRSRCRVERTGSRRRCCSRHPGR